MKDNPLRALIYVRVSTLEQANDGYSLGVQEERLKSYARSRGYTIVKTYRDPGYSGANLERPALQSMIKQIEKGLADVVLVYKLDRISRSQKDTLYLIEEVFLKNKVDFISINESFDTSTPFGRAMIGILSVFAQLEREQIRERSMMGKLARAKEGKWHGGGHSRIAIGYDYIDGELKVNDFEAACVRYLFDEYEKGKGLHTLHADITKKFPGVVAGDSTIYNILRNPLYIGKLRYKGEEYDGLQEPLISEEQFRSVQELMKKKVPLSNVFRRKYLLSGIIYCGHCGAKIHGRTGSKLKSGERMRYYVCYSRQNHRPHMVKDLNCKKKSERKEKIEHYVIDLIKELNVDSLEAYKPENDSTLREIEVFEKEISNIDKQISKLIDLYSLDDSPIELITDKVESLNSKRNDLKNNVDEMNANLQNKDDLKDIKKIVSQLDDFDWESQETDEKRLIISQLINKIIVTDDKVTIEWAF